MRVLNTVKGRDYKDIPLHPPSFSKESLYQTRGLEQGYQPHSCHKNTVDKMETTRGLTFKKDLHAFQGSWQEHTCII